MTHWPLNSLLTCVRGGGEGPYGENKENEVNEERIDWFYDFSSKLMHSNV